MLSLPLLIFPRIVLILSSIENEARTVLTPVEAFLALHMGLGLFAMALGLVLGVSPFPGSGCKQQYRYHITIIDTFIKSHLQRGGRFPSLDRAAHNHHVSLVPYQLPFSPTRGVGRMYNVPQWYDWAVGPVDGTHMPITLIYSGCQFLLADYLRRRVADIE